MKLSTDRIGESGADVTATVRNTGDRSGTDTLQIYVKVCREGTPNAQLKGIRKVHLSAGESREVSVHLPREAFGVYDEEGKLRIDGDVKIYVGGQAPDARSEKLTGRKVTELRASIG